MKRKEGRQVISKKTNETYHQEGRLLCELLLGCDVVADVAELLLHHPDGFEVGRLVEGVAAEQQQLDQIAGDVSPGNVETPRQMRQREALVDGADVRHAVAGIDDDTSQKSLSVERQNGLKKEIDTMLESSQSTNQCYPFTTGQPLNS